MNLKKRFFIMALVVFTIAGCSNNVDNNIKETEEKIEDVNEKELEETEKAKEAKKAERVGPLGFEDKFAINGVEYKLPMTFAELKAIPELEYDEQNSTELSARISGTESLWLNHGEDNEVNVNAEISNYSPKAISIDDAIVTSLSFNANTSTLENVNSWEDIVTVDKGITFGMDYYDFITKYDPPIDPDAVNETDTTKTFSYALDSDETDENRVEISFNKFDEDGKDKFLLRSLSIKIDDTQMNLNEDNKIK